MLICIFSNKNLSVKIFKWLARFCLRFYLFKFDLKSDYHHVEIFPDHRRFLAFSWDFGNGVLKYFQFAVLPFGLSSAPYLFTKLLRPVIISWRCKGIPVVIFS